MTKQMRYYEKVVPVSAQRHREWALEDVGDFAFAGLSNSVPLVAGEFAAAAGEYAIVFAGSGDALSPVVILGVEPDQNLYLDDNNQWSAKYIPAFVRRYPFVFSQGKGENQDKFTLCIDEQHGGWNSEGDGNRLFDADGTGSDYLQKVMNFVREYQRDFIRTQALCRKLDAMDLLSPMAARFQLPSGDKAQLTGFQVIDREKLNALPGDTLAQMAKTGQLEFIYAHLQSLRNLEGVLRRMPGHIAHPSGSRSLSEMTDGGSDDAVH